MSFDADGDANLFSDAVEFGHLSVGVFGACLHHVVGVAYLAQV